MLSFIRVRHFMIAGVITLAVLFASLFVSCTAEQLQQAAKDVHNVTSTEEPFSTTQPTDGHGAAVKAARTIVRGAAAASPPIGQIVSIVALLSSLVAGFAGHKIAKRSAHNVISEIVEDVATFKEPETPWTPQTAELLWKLGHELAASVDPAK